MVKGPEGTDLLLNGSSPPGGFVGMCRPWSCCRVTLDSSRNYSHSGPGFRFHICSFLSGPKRSARFCAKRSARRWAHSPCISSTPKPKPGRPKEACGGGLSGWRGAGQLVEQGQQGGSSPKPYPEGDHFSRPLLYSATLPPCCMRS